MFAIYDGIDKKFATCMVYPMFGIAKHWSDDVMKARLHEKVTITRPYFNSLIKQILETVPQVHKGVFNRDLEWDKWMRAWAEEADRRTDAGFMNFGLQIVEVEIVIAKVNITKVK